eukprot:6196239-Pleurochrysis_carterae.AAC.4
MHSPVPTPVPTPVPLLSVPLFCAPSTYTIYCNRRAMRMILHHHARAAACNLRPPPRHRTSAAWTGGPRGVGAAEEHEQLRRAP